MFNSINFFSQCTDNIDDNLTKIDPVTTGHMMKLIHFDPYLNQILCRGRKCNDGFNKTLPIRKENLSYPLDSSKIGLGRANRAGEPMFYASTSAVNTTNNEAGAYSEIGMSEGDKAIISFWGIKERLNLFNIGNSAQIKPESNPANISSSQKAYMESDVCIRKDFFLAELFSVVPDSILLKNKVYAISTAVVEKILKSPIESDTERDGILYPSIKFTKENESVDNIALTPKAVEKLQLLWVEEILVKHFHSEGIDIHRLDSASSLNEKGELIWEGKPRRMYGLNQDGSKFEVFFNSKTIE